MHTLVLAYIMIMSSSDLKIRTRPVIQTIYPPILFFKTLMPSSRHCNFDDLGAGTQTNQDQV